MTPKFDLSKLEKELANLADDALAELSDASDEADVDAVDDKYLLVETGLINKHLNDTSKWMNHRWASRRSYLRAWGSAWYTVRSATLARHEEIAEADEAAVEEHRLWLEQRCPSPRKDEWAKMKKDPDYTNVSCLGPWVIGGQYKNP